MAYKLNDMPEPIAPALIEKYGRVETATVGHIRHMGFMDGVIQCVLPGGGLPGRP